MARKGPNGFPEASTSWKDVTLRIQHSDEKIVLPVMAASRVWDVKVMLAEMLDIEHPSNIEFLLKNRKHRNSDEIGANVVVRGIKSFQKAKQEYPHPYCIIGTGHMGLRHAVQFCRDKTDFVAFDRMDRFGGNCWVRIANPTSKLQSEGPQYQLQYDPYDGNLDSLLSVDKYGYWPSRLEILEHFQEVADRYGVPAHVRLLTEVVDMKICDHPDFVRKSYDMHWKSLKSADAVEPAAGDFKCSCILYYPGALVVPHRKTWPGEDIFDGQIGYGFSSEFDYTRVSGQDAVIIGMGAFAHENVRTFVEHGGRKVYVIARRFNLMLPRVICWWMNQSICAPTGAMCLDAMKPMYDILGWDPWSFFSVTANEERTVANIKQYTRWGISDVFFLSIYFEKAAVVNAEVKRFKTRAVVLNNGNVIADIDHIMKVIGFDADFTVDRIMHTKQHLGIWPDSDWRRCVISDNSAIDASRFNGVNVSPVLVSFVHTTNWYFQHPKDVVKPLHSGLLPMGLSQPEFGSPAYHYEPRQMVATWTALVGCIPDMVQMSSLNDEMKKGSAHLLAPPHKFIVACKADWDAYGRLFRDQGCKKPKPPYPYTVEYVQGLVKQEQELAQIERSKQEAKYGIKVDPTKALEAMKLEPGNPLTFEPARTVLIARSRSPSVKPTAQEQQQWLQSGREIQAKVAGPRAITSPKA